MMRSGLIVTACMIVRALQAVPSPLSAPTNYVFTSPTYTNFIKGFVMGPGPSGYQILRGEDQIYLYEAYSELDLLTRAMPNSSATIYRNSGIDRLYPWGMPSGNRGAVYDRLYRLFANVGTNNLVRRNADITAQTNIWPISSSYSFNNSTIARDAVLHSHAAVTNYPAATNLANTGMGGWSRAMSASPVAALYQSLCDTAGIAKDYSLNNSTTYNPSINYISDDSAMYDWQNESWEYTNTTSTVTNNNGRIGGGYSDSLNSTAMCESENGSLSDVLYYMNHTSVPTSNDPVTVPLFPTNYARAAQLSAIKPMIAGKFTYSYTASSGQGDYYSFTTNFAMIISVESTVFIETNGITTAVLTPMYNPDAFYASTGLMRPNKDAKPSTPSGGGFAYATYLQITAELTPVKAAMIYAIDWHTGFNRLQGE